MIYHLVIIRFILVKIQHGSLVLTRTKNEGVRALKKDVYTPRGLA